MGVPVSESIWVIGIVEAEVKEHPQDPKGKVLNFVLQNGRQYLIPLQGDLLTMVQRGVSPVTLAKTMPRNGHGI